MTLNGSPYPNGGEKGFTMMSCTNKIICEMFPAPQVTPPNVLTFKKPFVVVDLNVASVPVNGLAVVLNVVI